METRSVTSLRFGVQRALVGGAYVALTTLAACVTSACSSTHEGPSQSETAPSPELLTQGTQTAQAQVAQAQVAQAQVAQAQCGTSSRLIDNNSVWLDQSGAEIKAQGGTILQEGDVYHWVGPEFESSDKHFRAINHYTSRDLSQWTKQAPILTPGTAPSAARVSSTSWVGRPWLMKRGAEDYVMWLELGKLSGSPYRNRFGVFHSSSVEGPWQFVRDYESLPDASGTPYPLGDLGAYHDVSTGKAYLLYTFDKGETNGSQAILELSPDFLSVLSPAEGGVVAEFPKEGAYCKEAAALFKRGSTYYFIMSETRGWKPSNTWYRTASSIGPAHEWSALKRAALSPSSGALSFQTQHDFVLPITGDQGTTYVYVGDRWSLYAPDDYSKAVGRQAWFPLSFNSNGDLTIEAPNFIENGGDWYLDVTAGTWSATPPAAN